MSRFQRVKGKIDEILNGCYDKKDEEALIGWVLRSEYDEDFKKKKESEKKEGFD